MSSESNKPAPRVRGPASAKLSAVSSAESVLRARNAWLAYALASLGPVLTWFLLGVLAPSFGSGRESPALEGQVISGGRIGIAVAFVLSMAVAVWIHRSALKGGFMAPLAIGFLVKLFLLAGGTMLLWGPLAHWGRPGSFAICFAMAAFTFQLTFLPILDRTLRPKD